MLFHFDRNPKEPKLNEPNEPLLKSELLSEGISEESLKKHEPPNELKKTNPIFFGPRKDEPKKKFEYAGYKTFDSGL